MTATDIVPTTPTIDLAPTAVPTHWEASWKLAQRIASTPFVPGALRGKPESVLAAVLYGAELNLGPMQSLASIHVIDGRPAAAPELMRALIARAGHRITVVENTDDSVTLDGQRSDTGATARVTWSMADAQRANLLGKGAWKTYPRAMLLARATSELARMLYADVIAGLSYTPEEVASIEAPEWTDDPPASPAPEATSSAASDPSIVLFERLKAVADNDIVIELRAAGEAQGRRLTTAEFAAYPEWRAQVHALLEQLLADRDVVDAEVVDDGAVVGPRAPEDLHAHVVAAAGTRAGDQLAALAARAGRQLTVEEFARFPVWSEVVGDVLATVTDDQTSSAPVDDDVELGGTGHHDPQIDHPPT
jgi:hypothetical protein